MNEWMYSSFDVYMKLFLQMVCEKEKDFYSYKN